jgi:hypothetical protein
LGERERERLAERERDLERLGEAERDLDPRVGDLDRDTDFLRSGDLDATTGCVGSSVSLMLLPSK